jgi:hypothetical protein
MDEEMIHEELSGKIIGAAMDVPILDCASLGSK